MRPSTKKNRWTAPALASARELIDPKKKTLKTISTNQLVLAFHQKDEEEPRRVNNKHDEAYRVLPREVVRRP